MKKFLYWMEYFVLVYKSCKFLYMIILINFIFCSVGFFFIVINDGNMLRFFFFFDFNSFVSCFKLFVSWFKEWLFVFCEIECLNFVLLICFLVEGNFLILLFDVSFLLCLVLRWNCRGRCINFLFWLIGRSLMFFLFVLKENIIVF